MRTALVLASLLASTPALAGRNNSALGLGVTTTLGGTSGLNVGKYLSERFALEVPLGLAVGGRFGLGTGVFAVPQLAGDETWGLHLVGGLEVRLVQAGTTGGNRATAPDFGLGLGFRGDWLPTPAVQFYAQAGLSAWLYGQSTAANAVGLPTDTIRASGFGLRVGPTTPLGVVGLTWWIGAR